MKIFRNIAAIILVILGITILSLCTIYNINIKAVDKNDDSKIEIVIPQGTSKKEVGNILEENGLIRSSTFFSIYIKLFDTKDFKASTYYLSKNMDLKEIINVLENGNSYNPDQIAITFKEGINIRKLATLIQDNTNNSYDDVINTLNDKEYLDELIEKYWFITDSIKNDKLYYSLEGYLFPDTYYFSNKSVTVKEIIEKMLDKMEKVLEEYKDEIENSSLSIHEILTLASIIEKEGKTKDFGKISSVFYNRLKLNMSLGIGGVLTFKNEKKLKEVVKTLDIKYFVLETDSPYLSPEPYRGKENEPARIIHIASKIAQIKNISLEKVLEITTNTAITQFDLKK